MIILRDFVKLNLMGCLLGLDILCITFLARKLSKPEDSRYRPETCSFSIADKHHHLAVNL